MSSSQVQTLNVISQVLRDAVLKSKRAGVRTVIKILKNDFNVQK